MSKKPIPVNLITGFLGVGKTTAILDLLKKKPENENWAVLVNEFGEVAVDQAMINIQQGLSIKEVPGGCMCCTANIPVQMALKTIINDINPDRIIIEPTGLGHAPKILDMLRNEFFSNELEVRATICLVNPAQYNDPKVAYLEIFQDQINLADVLVANKTDLVDKKTTREFMEWAETLFPPKVLVASTTMGQLDPAWLDADSNPERPAQYPDLHDHEHVSHDHEEETTFEAVSPDWGGLKAEAPGKPLRKESKGLGKKSCGWVFAREDIFDQKKLLDFLQNKENIARAKGVFRVGKSWLLINVVDGHLDKDYVAYRRDSRLEVIVNEEEVNWDDFEKELMQCLQ